MRLVGRPELIDEPWFATGAGRAAHADVLDEAVGAWIARRTRAEAIAAFEKAEAAIAPIQDVRDVMADPQYQALDTITDGRRPRTRPAPDAERPLPALRDPRRDPLGGPPARRRHRRRPHRTRPDPGRHRRPARRRAPCDAASR